MPLEDRQRSEQQVEVGRPVLTVKANASAVRLTPSSLMIPNQKDHEQRRPGHDRNARWADQTSAIISSITSRVADDEQHRFGSLERMITRPFELLEHDTSEVGSSHVNHPSSCTRSVRHVAPPRRRDALQGAQYQESVRS